MQYHKRKNKEGEKGRSFIFPSTALFYIVLSRKREGGREREREREREGEGEREIEGEGETSD